MVVYRRHIGLRDTRSLCHRLHRIGVFAMVSLVRAAGSGKSRLYQRGNLRSRREVLHDRSWPQRVAAVRVAVYRWTVLVALDRNTVGDRRERDGCPAADRTALRADHGAAIGGDGGRTAPDR